MRLQLFLQWSPLNNVISRHRQCGLVMLHDFICMYSQNVAGPRNLALSSVQLSLICIHNETEENTICRAWELSADSLISTFVFLLPFSKKDLVNDVHE